MAGQVIRPGEYPPGPGPTVLRLTVGAQLRRWREARGISRHDAGRTIRASEAKISRLELGRVGFKPRDIADLLALYGVQDARERDAFLTLARTASLPGWWHTYSDVLPSWFEMYIGLEQDATTIRSYQVQFVPGLCQTADYARAVIQLGHPAASVEDIALRVDLRLARQRILTAPNAPWVWILLDEAALCRPIGGADVMRAQLEHLIEMTGLPNVTLQIVPFHMGGHAAAGGPFSILRFADPDVNDIAYLEQLTSALYLEKRVDVDHYLLVMDRLCAAAPPPEQTRELLARHLAGLATRGSHAN